MFHSFRRLGLATAILIAATINAGPSSANDVTVMTSLENTMDTQEAVLDVTDNIAKDSVGTRNIHLGAPTINGKPSMLASRTPFKVAKDPTGNFNLKVVTHCGSNSDSATYKQPVVKIQILAGCKLMGRI